MTPAHAPSPVLAACVALIHMVGRTLPAAERDDWVKEWTAEMRGEWLDLEDRGQLTVFKRAAMVRRCLGAVVDAAHFWIEALFMTLFDFRTALRAPRRRRGRRERRRRPGWSRR